MFPFLIQPPLGGPEQVLDQEDPSKSAIP